MIESIAALLIALGTLLARRQLAKHTKAAESAAERQAEDTKRIINGLVWTQQAVIAQGSKLDTFVEEHDKAHKVINDRLNIR